MFINGILRNIEIVMDQSATIASLSRYFTVLDKWSASSVSNERFAKLQTYRLSFSRLALSLSCL